MKPIILAALALAGLSAGAAWGAIGFSPGGATVNIAATTTTANVALPGGASAPFVRVYNAGAVAVFVACGGSGVTATVAAGMPIGANASEVIGCGQGYVAAITSTTATVYFTPGNIK